MMLLLLRRNWELLLLIFDLGLFEFTARFGLLRRRSFPFPPLPLVGRLEKGAELIHGSAGDAGFSDSLKASSLGGSTCSGQGKEKRSQQGRGGKGGRDRLIGLIEMKGSSDLSLSRLVYIPELTRNSLYKLRKSRGRREKEQREGETEGRVEEEGKTKAQRKAPEKPSFDLPPRALVPPYSQLSEYALAEMS